MGHFPVKALLPLCALLLATPAAARPLYSSLQDCDDRHGLMIQVRAMEPGRIASEQERARALALLANSRVGVAECIYSFEAAGERVPFSVIEFSNSRRNEVLRDMGLR